MAAGGTLTLSGGADLTLSATTVYSFIKGAGGTQGVVLSTAGQTLTVTNLDHLWGAKSVTPKETVTLGGTAGNTLAISFLETIFGNTGKDVLVLQTAGQTMRVSDVETLVGGSTGTDFITLTDTGGKTIAFSFIESIMGSAGEDVASFVNSNGSTAAVGLVETIIGHGANDLFASIGTLPGNTVYFQGAEIVLGSGAKTDVISLGTGGNTMGVAFLDTLIGNTGYDIVSNAFKSGTIEVRTGGMTMMVKAIELVAGGSAGKDTLILGDTNTTITISDIDTLIGSAGGQDVVTVEQRRTTPVFGTTALVTATSTGTMLVALVETLIGTGAVDVVSMAAPGASSGTTMTVAQIETVIGFASGGNDVVRIGQTGGATVNVALIETLLGTAGADVVTMSKIGSFSNTMQVVGIETVVGSAGDDVIAFTTAGTLSVGAIEKLIGSGGLDAAVLQAGVTTTMGVVGIETLAGGDTSNIIMLDAAATLSVAMLGTLIGTVETDVVRLSSGATNIEVRSVETLIGSDSADAVRVGSDGTHGTTTQVSAVETLIGTGAGVVLLGGSAGQTITAGMLATLFGTSGNDLVNFASTGNTTQVSGIETLIGSGGTNAISVIETAGTVYVSGIETLITGDGKTLSLAGEAKTVVFGAQDTLSPPILASDSGTQGDNLTNDTTPTLTGSTTANAVVNLYGNGTLLGTGTADGTGLWTATATGTLAAGTWTMTARTVAGGTEGPNSQALLVTIDTAAPAAPATVVLAAGSDDGLSGSDRIISLAQPTITGSAAAGSVVALYDGTASVGTTTVGSLGVWSITSASLGAGTHTLTARAISAADNTSAASSPLVVTVDVASETPAGLALSAGSITGSLTDATNKSTPAITGTVEPNSIVSIYEGNALLGTGTANGSGVFEVTVSALGEGAHTLTARAVDPAGHTSAASASLTITVDTTPPGAPGAPVLVTASDNGRSNSDRLTSVTTPTFTGTAEANALVEIVVAGSVVGTGTAGSLGAWTITTGTLSDGTLSVLARTRDAAGNTRDGTSTLSVTIDTTAPSSPVGLGLTGATDSGIAGDRLTSVTAPTMTGTAEALAEVQLHHGSTLLGTTTANAQGAWSIATGTLAEGANTLSVLAVDAAGNTSSPAATVTVTVDTTASAAGGMALTTASDTGVTGDAKTNQTTPSVTGTAEPGVVHLYEGSTYLGTGTADSNGAWTVTVSGLGSGVHTLEALAVDAAGNTAGTRSSLAITVDVSAPSAPTGVVMASTSDTGTPGDNRTSNGVPTITGQGEVGGTVRLYDGTLQVGTATLDGAGLWSVVPGSSLGAGTHTLTVRVVDAAGNTGAASSALVVTIDTTSDIPSGMALAAGSDSGSSASDGLTNVTAPTVSGSAEAGAVVTLYEGPTALGTATANGSGVWSVTSSSLGEGPHTLTARAIDSAGNTSTLSSGLVIEIDTTGPTLATPTADDSQFSPTVSGTAVAGNVISLYNGTAGAAALFGTATADVNGAWSITTPELAGDTYTLTARAVDAAGNSSAPALVTVTITGRPGVPGSLAFDGGSDTGSTGDNITNLVAPTIVGTALASSTVTLYSGVLLVGTTTSDSNGLWTVTSNTLAAGAHTLTAQVYDGTRTLTSSALTITIDTTAPNAPGSVALAAGSDSGSSASDGVTRVVTPTLTGSAESNSVVILYDGATAVGTATASGTGLWSATTHTLAAGTHTLTAVAADTAGNTGTASSPLQVTIDTTAEAAGTLVLASDSGTTGDNRTNILAATISGTGEAGATVTLYDGSSNAVGSGTVAAGGAWTITAAALGDGLHTLTAVQVDSAGNTSDASAALTITIDATAPDAPTALAFVAGADTGSSTTDTITSNGVQTVTGSAEANSTVLLYSGASQVGSFSTDASGLWTIAAGTLGAGVHSLTARAIDTAGNTGTASTALVITVDTTTPNPSGLALATASDTGRLATDRVTNATDLTVTGTAEAGSTVIVAEGGTALGTVTAGGDGAWTFNGTAFANGLHTLSATAVDPAGNTSAGAGTLVVTVDLSVDAPGTPVLAPASDTGVTGDSRTRLLSPTITGTAEANAVVSLYDHGSFVALGTADGAGNWTVTAALAAGDRSLTAIQVDLAGNTSTASAALTITVDATAPDAPALGALNPALDSGSSNSDRLTNVTTQVLAGSAEANSVVVLYSGTTPVGTTTADGSGLWTVTSSSLADGVHSLNARAVDAAGNTSTGSAPLVVTIDTTTPAASAVAITSATDSGRSSGDGITRNTVPVLTGSAEAGSQVVISDGGTPLGTVTATGGAWSLSLPSLADGAHTLTVVSVDLAGNTATASGIYTVTVDTAAATPGAPAVHVSSDGGIAGDSTTVGDGLTNDQTPTLVGTVEAHAAVTLYRGAASLGTVTADANGAWTFTTSTLAQGVHTLSARIVDLAGNTSAPSSALILTIDVTNLDLYDLALSPASDRGSSNSDALTNLPTPTVTGRAEANAQVTLSSGGTPVGTAVAGSDGAFTLTVGTLSAGVHTLVASSVDRAGNGFTGSGSVIVTIDLSSDTPNLLMGSKSDTGASDSDRITSLNAPTLSGTAEAGSTVILTSGGTAVGTVLADNLGRWSAAPSLADGLHTLVATAIDAAGNTSAASTPLQVTIDTVAVAPTLGLAASSNGGSTADTLTNDSTPDITGSFEAGGIVSLYEGATLRGSATADGSGLWTITSGQLGSGAHTLTAIGTDVAGNSATSAELVVTIDTTAPAAAGGFALAAGSDTGASSTDGLTSAAAPGFSGSAEADSTIVLYDGSTAVGTATAGGDGLFTVAPGGALTDGTHSLKAVVIDTAGNTGAATSTLTITVDTAAPATGTLSFAPSSDTGASSTDGITSNTAPTVTGTVEANSVVTLYDGSTVVGLATANGIGLFSATATLAAGAHTLTAVAVDRAGNTGSPSAGFVVSIDLGASAPTGLTLVSGNNGLTNSGTPSVSGTAEANAVITLYGAGNQLGSATADGNGVWTVTTSALGEGTHTLTARQVDVAGNTSTASAGLAVTIDTTAPGAPGAPALATVSDSGTAGDRITAAATPTFAGTAAANSIVRLYDGTALVGQVTAGSLGAWTITSSALDGSTLGTAHTLHAVALDAAGNTSAASAPLTVTIDTAAAAPTLTGLSRKSDSGVPGDLITSNTMPTLYGTAEANSVVTLYDALVAIGTATADSTGSWIFQPSHFTTGETSYTLTATIVDAAGNTSGLSSALVVTIDTVPDDVSIDLDPGSDNGSAGDRITSVTTPVFTGTAGTAGVSATVVISDGATALGTVTTDGSRNWTFTAGALSGGMHTITASSEDQAGNAASSSVVITVDLTGDAPTGLALATTSDSGRNTTDRRTNDTTPTVTGSAEADSVVTLYDNGGSVGVVTANAVGSWSYTFPTLTEGTHSLTAIAVDSVDNTSIASTALVVTVDLTGEQPTGLALASASDTGVAGDRVTRLSTPTITGTTDANNVVLLYDGDNLVGQGTADGSGLWSITSSGLSADSERTLTARAIDVAGNTSLASAPLLITIDQAAPAGPTLALSAGSDTGTAADNVTRARTPTVSGSAEAGAVVTLYDGGSAVGTVTADNAGLWTITTSATLSAGVHSLTASAVDTAGNTGSASAPLVVTIDITASAPSSLAVNAASDTGPSGTDGITGAGTPTITGAAEAFSVVTLRHGATSVGTATADSVGAWSVTPATTLTDGTYTLTATAVDPADNTSASSASLVVTIDTVVATPGTPVLATDLGRSNIDGITSTTTPAITGSAEALSTVSLYDGGALAGVATADGSGAWTIVTSALGEGTRTLTAVAVDRAGNTSAASSGLAVTIDVTAVTPTLALTAGSDTGEQDNDSITRVTTPTVVGSAEALSVVTLYDGGTLKGTTTADANGAWTITASSLSSGKRELTVRAVDVAGNTAVSAAALTVTVDTVAPGAPTTLSLDAGSDTGTQGNNQTSTHILVINGKAEADATVLLFDGATQVASGTADETGNWQVTTGTLGVGSRTLTALAVDLAGNSSAASSPLILTLLPEPAAPTGMAVAAASDTGVAGDNITRTGSPLITGTTAANNVVTLYELPFRQLGTATADGSGRWTISAGTLSEGRHSLGAIALNPDGEESVMSSALVVSIDLTAPAAPTTLHVAGDTDTTTNNSTPPIAGTAEAGSTVVLYQGATAIGTATAHATTGAWTITAPSLSAGQHTLTAQSIDGAGNSSSASSNLTVTIDQTAPTLLGSSPADNAASILPGANLVLTFNEAMQAGSGSIYIRQVNGGAIAGSISVTDTSQVTVSGSTVTINPAGDLGELTAYYLEMASGVLTDRGGNSYAGLSGSTELNFTTGVAPPPPPTSPPPPPPPPPTVTQTVDGVVVQQQTTTHSDGSTTKTTTIPVVTDTRQELTGNNTVADIPLVTQGSTALLSAQVPTGIGMTVSGSTETKSAGASVTDLIREIEARTDAGSADRQALTGGGTGFLSDLPASTPLIVQTIVPTVAGGQTTAPTEPLVISAPPAVAGQPMTALVIDTRGLPSGTVIQLQNVSFAAVVGAVQVTGGDGSQNVFGDGAAQFIVLGADDDTLHGGDGADTMGSRTGNDLIYGDGGDDNVFGGDDDDRVFGGSGLDTVSGNKGADYVQGNQGNDTVHGGQDNDTVRGGQDDDRIHGDLGDDLAYGDFGSDVIYGNAGHDTLWGGDGNDVARDTADTIHGGQGNDVVYAQYGDDSVSGDLGDDYLEGNKASDTLSGGDGADTLRGGRDDDLLSGDAGNDELWGDLGNDTLGGGAGADLFRFRGSDDGADLITDFSFADGDRIGVAAGIGWSVAGNGQGDAVITFAGGGSITLKAIAAQDVTAAWITTV